MDGYLAVLLKKGERFMKNGYNIVPKIYNNVIYIVYAAETGEKRVIGQIQCPIDGQLNHDVELAEAVALAVRKRLRKSI